MIMQTGSAPIRRKTNTSIFRYTLVVIWAENRNRRVRRRAYTYGRPADERYKADHSKKHTELRKAHKFTQAELAERLNYSDKAVSKWERAESIPDVMMLQQIASMFGVTVDYLLTSEHVAKDHKAGDEQGRQAKQADNIPAFGFAGLSHRHYSLRHARAGYKAPVQARCGRCTYTLCPWPQ